MPLPYNKWTDEQITNRNVSDEGDYPFKILNAVQKTTKQKYKDGKPLPCHQMLVIDFEFHDLDGVVKKAKDWIVFIENMDWKLRHLCNTTGLLDLYDNEVLEANDLINKAGVFTLGVKEMQDQNGETKKVNFVKDYVKKAESAPSDDFQDDVDILL